MSAPSFRLKPATLFGIASIVTVLIGGLAGVVGAWSVLLVTILSGVLLFLASLCMESIDNGTSAIYTILLLPTSVVVFVVVGIAFGVWAAVLVLGLGVVLLVL